MLGVALILFGEACVRGGWMDQHSLIGAAVLPELLQTGAWLGLFLLTGLYGDRYSGGRFDELASLAKVTVVGSLGLFFGYYLDRLAPGTVRSAVGFYAVAVFVSVSVSRLTIRTVQKALILRGYGRRRAVVIGWSDRVETLYHDLASYPAAGIELVGAVRLEPVGTVIVSEASVPAGDADVMMHHPSGDALPDGAIEVTSAGAPRAAIAELPRLIDQLRVTEVLITLGSGDHTYLDEVLRACEGSSVSLKLVPDFYTAVGGMARTEHSYGLPLIEVFPEPIAAWQRSAKRVLDILIAASLLVAGAPIWLLIAGAVRLNTPGPAIYRQKRVGQFGRTFTMLKYRTMYNDAEKSTGPVWAKKADLRVTPLGRLLRRFRLDEIPQLWNVVKGDMSLVGPRPERPFFVERLVDRIPLYSRRHRVQPGITGLAQVKWRYDSDLDDVRQKLKFDLFYIETMSLGMDAKILFQTVRTALFGNGH